MRLSFFKPIACASLLLLPVITFAVEDTVLEEVVVTATLRPQSLQDVPSSVTVLDSQTLKDAGQQHFQDVLGLVPNLNASGTGSRPRYFQLRGIGEHDQFTPVLNPSVGFLIDDMDFSGVGMPANLFDMKQVEVFRGPQGTRYGANALAGLIAMRSNDPSNDAQISVENTFADKNTLSIGASATAPIESLNSAWRLSIQKYQSDGFMNNSYLGRKDTNGRDELSARFKWHTDLSDMTAIDFTLMHVNLDNGYDAWTLDNSRTSLSDRPGVDTQRSTGASVKVNSKLTNGLLFTGTGSFVNSNNFNSYDGDWANNQFFQNLLADLTYVRDQLGSDDRSRETRSFDLRLASDNDKNSINWLAGVYLFNLVEKMNMPWYEKDKTGISQYIWDSKYKSRNFSLYAQLDNYITPRWSWSLGVRGERHDADYSDNAVYIDSTGNYPTAFNNSPTDYMWGGQFSTQYDIGNKNNVYMSISRGYKVGGFNSGIKEKPSYGQEVLLNYELGAKGVAMQERLHFDAAIFIEQRSNVQITNSQQLPDSGAFVIYTDNAGIGLNTGIESSLKFKLNNEFELGSSLGLLRSETSAYSYFDSDGSLKLIPRRELAYAPSYTADLYSLWRSSSGWMARVDIQAKDHFYVHSAPDTHETKAYTVTNVKFGYELPKWDAYVWVMNFFNEDYSIHGFVFKNDVTAPKTERLYLQKGDPRQIGVTGSWKF